MPQDEGAFDRLARRIDDETLKNSLSLIREAANSLLGPDKTILVKNFTSHGPDHSDRLLKYIDQLLGCGQELSEIELYALMAAVFLHDIGMQCDRPEVHERLNLPIHSKQASTYSETEQVAIRKNHHLLSCEWLGIAYRSSENTKFNLAVKTIPSRLLKHVCDICRFHSQLDIRQ
jgi:hypothetical protein